MRLKNFSWNMFYYFKGSDKFAWELFAQCAHLSWLLARVIDNIEWRCHLTSAEKGAAGGGRGPPPLASTLARLSC